MELENEYLNEKEARIFLKQFTGHNYVFAQGAHRKWGKSEHTPLEEKTPYFQIMPDTVDDGFFNWYVIERSGKQFFELRETCIIHFLNYRIIWLNSKKELK
ncbi:hypothetical protein [Aquimarina intermedia]|uniref:Uncharacterized protein n=1 Tax=Aquimarina intermedia TaxID=350814 RepID=A0A5S5C5C0_9FLAO|nr:hypothetical protein [Aquimarina intermedia]TYP73662.1 hypothetical protein BD809_105253 [Aquimarina intermedia]